MVGTGVQITLIGFVTITIAAFCYSTPDARGLILTLIPTVYSFRGIVGGYMGVRKWRTLKGSIDGWKSVSWLITFLFPGIVLIVHVALNFIMWVNCSTAAISISTEIPAWTLPSWLLVLGAGMISFGTLVTELIFFLSSIWLGRFYSVLGTLCICLLSLVILCAETSLIVTYRNLQAQDWKWWWKSFCASGSASLFVFMYCINYLVSDPNGLSGPPSVTVYVGYLLIMAIAALLSTGSIGFLASLYFVNALFSSTEI